MTRSYFLNSYISPVSGRVLCDPTKILVGNADGIAVPSAGIPIGGLPDLTENKTWVGDSNNRPIEKNYIGDGTFVIRLANPLLPSAQVLSDIPVGILKVIADGYLAQAQVNIDYATEAGLLLIEAQISGYAAEAAASALAASGSALVASAAAAAAAGSAIAADQAAAAAEAAKNSIVDGGLNGLPVNGDLDMQGYRIINLHQSPEGDFDAISFTFFWDLLHDNVEILWPT